MVSINTANSTLFNAKNQKYLYLRVLVLGHVYGILPTFILVCQVTPAPGYWPRGKLINLCQFNYNSIIR